MIELLDVHSMFDAIIRLPIILLHLTGNNAVSELVFVIIIL